MGSITLGGTRLELAMRRIFAFTFLAAPLLLAATSRSTPPTSNSSSGTFSASHLHLPYREAGLSEREAAAHLLDRLAYGARPEDVDSVVEMGVERWAMPALLKSISILPKASRMDTELRLPPPKL